jgi:hypothetical protein
VDTDSRASTFDPTASAPTSSVSTAPRLGAGAVRREVDYDEIVQVLLDEAERQPLKDVVVTTVTNAEAAVET